MHSDRIETLGSYSDAYGVWFAGSLGAAVKAQCGYTHAFLSVKPEKLTDGSESDVTACEVPCKLYFWRAQGYNRGAIVAVEDDPRIHQEAERLMAGKPWDFSPVLNLPTLVAITLSDHIPPQPIVLNFGKYQGKTLNELAEENLHYLGWLAENCKEVKIRNAAQKLVAGKSL